MTENKYVIDASMGLRQGFLVLRPAKQDSDGNFVPDTEKPHVLSNTVADRNIVGIHHKDGPEALDAFCKQHKHALRNVLAQFL